MLWHHVALVQLSICWTINNQLGGMTNNQKINYPRSKLFNQAAISLDDYMYLTSCADLNTHKKDDFTSEFYDIGKKCMGYIDLDRYVKYLST